MLFLKWKKHKIIVLMMDWVQQCLIIWHACSDPVLWAFSWSGQHELFSHHLSNLPFPLLSNPLASRLSSQGHWLSFSLFWLNTTRFFFFFWLKKMSVNLTEWNRALNRSFFTCSISNLSLRCGDLEQPLRPIESWSSLCFVLPFLAPR